MAAKLGVWPRILICAAVAVGLALLGVAGQYLFRDAGGFPDLFQLLCTVLAILVGLVAVLGALNRLSTRKRTPPL
jgi:hypothetical protein